MTQPNEPGKLEDKPDAEQEAGNGGSGNPLPPKDPP